MSAAPKPREYYALDSSQFVPGVDGTFVNARGDKLWTRSWLPPAAEKDGESPLPIGVVVLCHGFVRCTRAAVFRAYSAGFP